MKTKMKVKTNLFTAIILSIVFLFVSCSNLSTEANESEKENGKKDVTKTDWEEIAQSRVLISFLVEPSFESPYGFCISKKKGDYILITKIIDNWDEVNKQMQAEFPALINKSLELIENAGESDTISKKEKDRRGAFNKIQRQKRADKALTLYNEVIKEYPIDKEEAKELYLRFVSFIDQYKKTEIPKNDAVSEGNTINFISDDGFGITISYTRGKTKKSVYEREIYLSEGFKELYEQCKQLLKER